MPKLSSIVAVLCIKFALIALGSSRSVAHNEYEAEPFELKESYDGSYNPLGFNGTWLSGNEFVYVNVLTASLRIFNVEKLKSEEYIQILDLPKVPLESLSYSQQRNYILIGHSSASRFRHSSYKKYIVFDVERRVQKNLADEELLLMAIWSPVENAVLYQYENDLYYQRFTEEETGKPRRLTFTGIPDVITNGVADWVYEEEVLRTGKAVWFSSDGRYLAYATFNDTNVHEAAYFYYGSPGNLEFQYPMEVKIKYPKPGTPNPIVTLHVVDLMQTDAPTIDLPAPANIVGDDCILYKVIWNGKNVIATWSNRVQNKAVIVEYTLNGTSKVLLNLTEDNGWLELSDLYIHGSYLVLVKSQDSGTPAGKFQHVTSFLYKNGILSNETDLTPGNVAVQMLVKANVNGMVYYLACDSEHPSQSNLYSVTVDGSSKPTCVSCSVITPEGNNCTYAGVKFSKDGSYYSLTCTGPDPAFVTLFDSSTKKSLATWEDNKIVREKLARKTRPIVKNLVIDVNGYGCHVRLLLPPNFDETKTYPMLVQVYAGPNTIRITDAYNTAVHSYLTTNRSVIYAWIDGRGSAFKGSKMLYEIYRGMGTVEVDDQIAVTKILQENNKWIDAKRTGIWGWSYGGFVNAMVMAKDKDNVFKCGVSVAPVTSWIYYDSIYTERYMGLPTSEDNLAGYNRTDVTRLVEGIRGKRFLLVHGTGDDNVLYQQSMALARSLELHDVLFEQMSYPDEAHGLGGVWKHLYHTLDRYWAKCFGYQ